MISGIYCIKNTINGMMYVGQGKNVEKRMNSSHKGSPYLERAILKHGKENFIRYILEYCEKSLLNEKEIFWIKKLNTKSPNGYNLTRGGEGASELSPESREKISKSHLGNKNPRYGKGLPEHLKGKGFGKGSESCLFGKKNCNASTSRFFGISSYKTKNGKTRWTARIRLNGKMINIKNSSTELEAVKAYNAYIVKMGLNNLLNVIEQ